MGSEQGGHDAAIYYSIIESCLAADVEPSAYLNDVIDRIAQDRTIDPRSLMPAARTLAREALPSALGAEQPRRDDSHDRTDPPSLA